MGKPLDASIGMTGEITLRGQILPVGGIKEKMLAAHRAGLKRVYLPRENEIDFEELPKEVREALNPVLVDKVDDVIRQSLMGK